MSRITDRITIVRKKFQELSLEEIKTYKFMMFFFIVVDIFGMWWWLKMKSLALAILIIIIIFLTIFLFLERQKTPPEDFKPEKPEQPKETKLDSSGLGLMLDMDDYNDRLEKALGKL